MGEQRPVMDRFLAYLTGVTAENRRDLTQARREGAVSKTTEPVEKVGSASVWRHWRGLTLRIDAIACPTRCRMLSETTLESAPVAFFNRLRGLCDVS